MSEMPHYEYFHDVETRAMIAECGFRVAEYLHDEQVGSLVLVDQAARNLHIPIRGAWDLEYPDEAKPTTYFLNPDGFYTPDIHDTIDYTAREHKMAYSRQGLTYSEYMLDQLFDPYSSVDTERRALRAERRDLTVDRRHEIASQLTPLAGKAIQRDSQFNGKVLVLDACRHTGRAAEGIVRALRDIGVIDVRTGVVNNIRNRGDDPDFIVFGNDEIEDACKPFGTQSGMARTAEMVPRMISTTLSDQAIQAKRELHAMVHDFTNLRDVFSAQAHQRQELRTFPADVQALLEDVFGREVRLREVRSEGLGMRLILPWSESSDARPTDEQDD